MENETVIPWLVQAGGVAVGVLLIAVGLRRGTARPRRVWTAMGIGLVLIGAVPVALLGGLVTPPDPDTAAVLQGLFAAGTLVAGIGVALAVRAEAGAADLDATIDAGVVSLAVGLTVWELTDHHMLRIGEDLTVLAGFGVALVLIGMAGQVAFAGRSRSPTVRWLGAAIIAGLLSSSLGLVDVDETVTFTLLAVAIICLGIAAVRPPSAGAPRRTSPDHAHEDHASVLRIGLLGTALIVPSVVLTAHHREVGEGSGLVHVGAAVTGIAVLWRLLRVVRDRDAVAARLRRANTELDRLAHRDTLTGLPNRRAFRWALHDALAASEEAGRLVAVLLVDLDRFKMINDGVGHGAGDELLTRVGGRLLELAGGDGTAARLGGDEFAVVCPDVGRPQHAIDLAERTVDRVGGDYVVEGVRVRVTASVGVALAESAATSPGDLLANADAAMYQAKREGRGRAAAYEPQLTDGSARRLDLATALWDAPVLGELTLVFQPEIDLRTGVTALAEALLRWDHPTYGRLSPCEFLDVAEETGSIIPIGAWVLREGCRRMRAWQQQDPGSAPAVLSMNVSARQLGHSDFVDTLRDALDESGVDPSTIWIEVTESSMMAEPGSVARILADVKALGVGIAIDDFGTGYSSLVHLKAFPLDALKIDRSFVAGMPDSAHDRSIVHAVVNLAHALGLAAVAEGVETAAQLRELRHIGCDFAQGYLLGRPVEAEAFTARLRADSATAAAPTEPTGRLDSATTAAPNEPAGRVDSATTAAPNEPAG